MSRKRPIHDRDDHPGRGEPEMGSLFDSLFNRSTMDVLMREAMQSVRTNGGAREAAEAVLRRNPMAVGVVGLGLAWLVLGQSRKTGADDAGPVRRAAAKARATVEDEIDAVDNDDWADALDRLRAKTSARLRELEEDAAAYREDVAAGLSDKAGDLRDHLSERAEILADLAEDMRERFSEGLEEFSQSARLRIVQAREEAYAARLKAQEALGKGGREAKRMVEDHPMVSAALVLTLGAALSAAMLNRRGKVEEQVDDAKDDVEELAKKAKREVRARWSRVRD